MSIRFRNKDGKVNDQPSPIRQDCTRDDIILDTEGVKELLALHYKQLYGHVTPPNVSITLLDSSGDMLVEVAFIETEYPIPF